MAPRRGCDRADRKLARYPARPGPRGSRKTGAAAREKKGFPIMRTCCASIATPVGRGPRPAAEPGLRGGQPG